MSMLLPNIQLRRFIVVKVWKSLNMDGIKFQFSSRFLLEHFGSKLNPQVRKYYFSMVSIRFSVKIEDN